MRLLHFLNKEFALKDIRERRLKIPRIAELNDPFEFLRVETSKRDYRALLMRAKAAIRAGASRRSSSMPIRWDAPALRASRSASLGLN